MRSGIAMAAVFLIALTTFGNAQGVSPNQSPGTAQQLEPQQQKRGKGEVKRKKEESLKAEGEKRSQNHGQAQTSTGNQNANANNAKVKPNTKPNTVRYSVALQKCVRERHDRAWWRQRYTVIVLVGGGYYYWDAGYWYPALGYDPAYETYDYDGPIFTYGNLLPDQVIVNVQRALKQLGYYAGGTTGSLGPATRQALANYQADAGLEATGAIDAATVEALGLY